MQRAFLTLSILLILATPFLAFAPLAKATPFPIDPSVSFGFTNGWMNFSSTQYFSTATQIGNVWYFDSNGITVDACNATITKWYVANWFNYTVSGPGSQLIGNTTYPTTVYVDGLATTAGWTSTSSGLNVSSATSTVQIYWGSLPTGHYLFDAGITWLLPAYNKTVAFSQSYTLDTFYWDMAGTTIYFSNFALAGGSNLGLIGFSTQNANMTVTSVFNGTLKIDYGLLSSSTSTIYYASVPYAATFNGVSIGFSFDGLSRTTVTTTSGAGTVEIDYSPTSPAPPADTYQISLVPYPSFLTNVQVVINETTATLPYSFVTNDTYTWLISTSASVLSGTTTYNFQSWTINGTIIEAANQLYLYQTSNTTLQANYIAGGTYIWPPGGAPLTFYLRNNILTTHGVMGYGLGETTHHTTTDGSIIGSEQSTSYGFRAFVVNSDNSTSELTPGYPVSLIARSVNGSGLLTAYWNTTGTSTTSAYGIVDALMIKVYQAWGSGSWTLRNTFITGPNQLFKLAAGTWQFNIYTSYVDYVTSSLSSYSWGDPATQTSLTIFTTQPSVFELQQYHLSIGDLASFTIDPFAYPLRFFSVNLAYSIVYAFIMIIIGVTLIIRNESITATALFFALFGGSGGLLTGMIPTLGLGIAWAFFTFGIALLLFRLVKGRSYAEP